VASENRSTLDRLALYRDLAAEPYKYDFFQALRLIECANFDLEKIGASQRPKDDPVRLGQEPSMAFAPSTLSGFDLDEALSAPHLSVLFFGLFGPHGPLPLHLTEFVRERVRNFDDESFARFADIFHHRLLSLFYRSWAQSQPTVNFDRPGSDSFSVKVGSLFGLGHPMLRNRDPLPDHAKLHFAARFANQARSAEGLLAVIRGYFDMPANLEQYVGSWLTIPSQDQMRLGDSPDSGSLGVTSTLGVRVWECQSKFRLTFGPLDMENYKRMLPGGASLIRLIGIVRNYVGDEFDWDVHLLLKGNEVTPARLGGFGQLGWTTWMPSDFQEEQFGDLYLNPMQELL